MTLPRNLTITEVAEVLSCSRPHVYALMSEFPNRFTISVPGSSRTKTRVPLEDVTAFIERSRMASPKRAA